MTLVTMKPWHLNAVIKHLREYDRVELARCGVKDLKFWAAERAESGGLSFTVLDDTLTPVCCLGVDDEDMPGIGVAWFMARDGFETYVKSMKKGFGMLLERCDYRRIHAFVSADSETCQNFAKWFGFQFAYRFKNFYPDGGAMDLYEIVRREDESQKQEQGEGEQGAGSGDRLAAG